MTPPADPVHRRRRHWPPPSRRSPRRTPASGCCSTTAAAPSAPGRLQPAVRGRLPHWPPAGTVTRYYLGHGGSLSSRRQGPRPRRRRFRPDPSVRPATDLPPGNAWAAQPPYNWTPVPAANGVAFQTRALRRRPPRSSGPASLDLWLRSARASHRSPGHGDRGPTRRHPGGVRHLRLPALVQPDAVHVLDGPRPRADLPVRRHEHLPAGGYTLVRIPIDPIAHVFRAGTRLRIVHLRAGRRPARVGVRHRRPPHGSVTDTVALGGHDAVVAGRSTSWSASRSPAALPACGALRGEPCRPYRPCPTRADPRRARLRSSGGTDGTGSRRPDASDPTPRTATAPPGRIDPDAVRSILRSSSSS